MRDICFKCKQSFERSALSEISLSSKELEHYHIEYCYLCPKCLEAWSKVYNKWRHRTGYNSSSSNNFWYRAWNEFILGYKRKLFNPSMRTKVDNSL